MRIFDFACDKCGAVSADVSVEGEISDAKVKCPECGHRMRVSFSGCGKFAMKGKFTYKNGYGLKG